MKKYLLMVLCTLTLVFGLTACGSDDDDTVGGIKVKNYELMLQSTMVQLDQVDEATADSYIIQSNSSGDAMSAELFEDWKKCYSVKGDFVDFYDSDAVIGGINVGALNIGGTKAFDVAKSGKTITATLVGHYTKKDLKLTYVFNANDMESGPTAINIEPVYSLGETMQKAGVNTIIGILIVFAMLVIMSGIIKSFELITKVQNNAKAKEETVAIAPEPSKAVTPLKNETDDLQLVAVIAAAIAASTGASTDSFVVRSIKKRH